MRSTIGLVLLLAHELDALKLGGLNRLGGNTQQASQKRHFDLIVIGGGSGGLAASKAAAELGKQVAVCDFVVPSPQNTTWGLGGTCVNVGCIPKKLMHHAAQLGEFRKDAAWYGWEAPEDNGEDQSGLAPEATHSWEKMVTNIQNYIKSMNFAYRAQCRSNDVEYFDAFATFTGPRSVEAVSRRGDKTTLTADTFILCTGGRPRYPDIPGAREHGITSDDLFSLTTPPGKTLVVGGGYVALESAGFLRGLGFDVTVLMRSVPLRGFDRQMAEHVVEYMEEEAVTFHRHAAPESVELLEDGRKRVTWQQERPVTHGDVTDGDVAHGDVAHGDSGGPEEPGAGMETCVADFDTVLFSVGRDAFTHRMGLDVVGVHRNEENGKIPVANEQTNVQHIYAIGDIVDGAALVPPSELTELTPVAIQAGQTLVQRLYGGSERQMDYHKVPTTVYTPLEYGMVGFAEEAAVAALGEECVEVYHQYFKPLEWRLAYPRRSTSTCYAKLICDKSDNERVVGLHIVGPCSMGSNPRNARIPLPRDFHCLSPPMRSIPTLAVRAECGRDDPGFCSRDEMWRDEGRF